MMLTLAVKMVVERVQHQHLARCTRTACKIAPWQTTCHVQGRTSSEHAPGRWNPYSLRGSPPLHRTETGQLRLALVLAMVEE